MKHTEHTEKSHILRYLAAALIPAALIAVFYLLAGRTEALSAVNAHFSRPLLDAMGSFFSRFSVSFMELDIILLVLACVIFAAVLVLRLARGRGHRLLTLIKSVLVLVCAAGVIWNGYCWLWNTGYYSASFAEQAGLESDGLTVEELTEACLYFRDRANELSLLVPRDEDGNALHSFAEALTDYEDLYDPLEEEFPCLQGRTTCPKGVHFSRIMSRLDFTGVFFPFTGETYINTDQPEWCLGETIAHEIAHQRGVHLEAECNFLGVAACLQSDDICYRYSGYATGLVHLCNALYKADRDTWQEIRSGFTEELQADWAYNTAYWQSMQNTATKVSNSVYSGFLKVNTQPSGLQSYGECVDLLVKWLETSSYSPMNQS